MPLQKRFLYLRAVLTYLSDDIMKISDMHNYITRQATDDRLFIPKFKTECLKHSLFVAGVTVWNTLSKATRSAPPQLFLLSLLSRLKF